MLPKVCVAFAILALFLSACGAVESAQAFTKVGNDFMTDLKNGDYEAAYALLHPNLQQEVGTAADLQNMIESNAAQPKDWSFSSVNAQTDADKVTTATLEGNVNFQDGKSGVVSLEMVREGEIWTILSFNLSW